ncbi:MAG: hypothetical protein LBR36_08230 [Bacteroidales bacterium]|jgi:hypothetical protein|nr:hypothetical protein [Bacteroidales bacterium]
MRIFKILGILAAGLVAVSSCVQDCYSKIDILNAEKLDVEGNIEIFDDTPNHPYYPHESFYVKALNTKQISMAYQLKKDKTAKVFYFYNSVENYPKYIINTGEQEIRCGDDVVILIKE